MVEGLPYQVLIWPGVQDGREGPGEVVYGTESEAHPFVPHHASTSPFLVSGHQKMAHPTPNHSVAIFAMEGLVKEHI